MAHELGEVIAPDLVGKVQRHVAVGAPGRVGEGAGKERRGVGQKQRLLRHDVGDRLVERGLLRRVLVDALDHDVRVTERLLDVGGKKDARQALLRGGLEVVDALGSKVAVVGKPAAVLGGIGLPSIERGDDLLLHAFQARLRALDRGLAAQPHGGLETLVRDHRGNLTALGAAPCDSDLLDAPAGKEGRPIRQRWV